MKKLGLVLSVLCLSSLCLADYLGSLTIDDYIGIPADTHQFTTGGVFEPSVLTYSIYEDANIVGLFEDVNMVPASPFDGIVGHYYVRIQLTTANEFEKFKNYHVVLKATVDGVSAIATHTFQINAKVDANTVVGEVPGDYELRFDTLDGKVDAAQVDITDTMGYALAAQTAAELIDTALELKTLLFGIDQNGITANVWTSTKAGYIDMKISDVNATAADVNIPYLVDTTVKADANNTASRITLTAGRAVAKAYLLSPIIIWDANNPTQPEIRTIISYSAERVVKVDRPFTFVPTTGDIAKIPESAFYDPTAFGVIPE